MNFKNFLKNSNFEGLEFLLEQMKVEFLPKQFKTVVKLQMFVFLAINFSGEIDKYSIMNRPLEFNLFGHNM